MAEKKTTKKAAAVKAEEPKKATVKKAAAPKKLLLVRLSPLRKSQRQLKLARRRLCSVWVGSSRRVSSLLLTRRLHLLNHFKRSIKGLVSFNGIPAFF